MNFNFIYVNGIFRLEKILGSISGSLWPPHVAEIDIIFSLNYYLETMAHFSYIIKIGARFYIQLLYYIFNIKYSVL